MRIVLKLLLLILIATTIQLTIIMFSSATDAQTITIKCTIYDYLGRPDKVKELKELYQKNCLGKKNVRTLKSVTRRTLEY